jgi:colanic acid/amylovoran biosynthesis protein
MRETAALEYAQKFTKSNVEQSHDIVLQNTEYNLSNIYSRKVSFKSFAIIPHSVGIIPSARVAERVEQKELCAAYQSMIRILIDYGTSVYILRHSEEDLEICRSIKDIFPDDTRVKLIQDDLNGIELKNVLEQFDFVIASRYHAIIHSYKKGVPAVVVGWAQKYSELVREFDQAEYYFDCRSTIDIDDLDAKLNKMIRNWAYEKEKIGYKAKSISEKNIFDLLKSDMTRCCTDAIIGNP